jgi:prepilin-type N-terminal cleavage/methylation domain-containing protein
MITSRNKHGFTLIELITVIAIILILMGLLFPGIQAVKESAKKLQAKNDMANIVGAVKAYYTEYGRYPVNTGGVSGIPVVSGTNATYGGSSAANTNDQVMNVLRCLGSGTNLNTRMIVFLEAPSAKDTNNPKAGIGTAAANTGQYFDPWGTPYEVIIDIAYANQIGNPYGSNGAGSDPIYGGVVALSFGKDKKLGNNNDGHYTGSDDVISWQ